MASMSIGSMSKLCNSSKKKSKPCPSEELAEAVDREVLRECLEEAEEVYRDATAKVTMDEPCCEEVYEDRNTTCDAPMPPPMPREGSGIAKMKVPRGIGRSIYDGPCGDGTNARATLEDWDIHGIRLAGRIYDDIRGQYPDGEMMYTETVQSDVSELKEGAIIRTRNTYYLLGKQHVPNDE